MGQYDGGRRLCSRPRPSGNGWSRRTLDCENLAADVGAGPPPGADAGAARERAAGYAMTKLLVVPLRSATYRGMMATADALEVGSAAFVLQPVWSASISALRSTTRTAQAGGCQ